jgi:hypothetical protein
MPGNTGDPRAVYDGLDLLVADCREILATDHLRGDPIAGHAAAALDYLGRLRTQDDPVGERRGRRGVEWRGVELFTADKRPDGRNFLAAPRGGDPGRTARAMRAEWGMEYALAGHDSVWAVYRSRRHSGRAKQFRQAIKDAQVAGQRGRAERVDAKLDEALGFLSPTGTARRPGDGASPTSRAARVSFGAPSVVTYDPGSMPSSRSAAVSVTRLADARGVARAASQKR